VGGGWVSPHLSYCARDLRQAGNKVLAIIGARNKDLLFWEKRCAPSAIELIVCTDDGSYGRKAL
jgi:ferredoxin--NADP+ reductase